MNWFARFRCDKITPGPTLRSTLSGTLESQHPSQSTFVKIQKGEKDGEGDTPYFRMLTISLPHEKPWVMSGKNVCPFLVRFEESALPHSDHGNWFLIWYRLTV